MENSLTITSNEIEKIENEIMAKSTTQHTPFNLQNFLSAQSSKKQHVVRKTVGGNVPTVQNVIESATPISLDELLNMEIEERKPGRKPSADSQKQSVQPKRFSAQDSWLKLQESEQMAQKIVAKWIMLPERAKRSLAHVLEISESEVLYILTSPSLIRAKTAIGELSHTELVDISTVPWAITRRQQRGGRPSQSKQPFSARMAQLASTVESAYNSLELPNKEEVLETLITKLNAYIQYFESNYMGLVLDDSGNKENRIAELTPSDYTTFFYAMLQAPDFNYHPPFAGWQQWSRAVIRATDARKEEREDKRFGVQA